MEQHAVAGQPEMLLVLLASPALKPQQALQLHGLLSCSVTFIGAVICAEVALTSCSERLQLTSRASRWDDRLAVLLWHEQVTVYVMPASGWYIFFCLSHF